MNRTKRRVINSKVVPSDYANIHTGELLSSEMDDKVSITMVEATHQFIINCDNYVTFTSEAMDYIVRELSSVDIVKVFRMSDLLKTDCCILMTPNNLPHTPDSLALVLDMNKDEFYRMIKRLRDKNILGYCVCSPSGYTQKIYILNPYVARKRTRINSGMKVFFRDVTKFP